MKIYVMFVYPHYCNDPPTIYAITASKERAERWAKRDKEEECSRWYEEKDLEDTE